MVSSLLNPMDRFLILACYEGLGKADINDIAFLKKEQIDFNNCCINYNMRRHYVSFHLINALKETINTNIYVFKGKTYKLKESKYVYHKFPSDNGNNTNFNTINTLRKTVNRLLREMGYDDCTILDLWYSGMVAYYNKLAWDSDLSVREYIRQNRKAAIERYGYFRVDDFVREYIDHIVE